MKYTLTHTYLINKANEITFTSSLSYSRLFEITAYVQYLADDIEECYEFELSDMFTIIQKFYDTTAITADNADSTTLDLYLSWERHDIKIMDNVENHREGLKEFLVNMING